MYQRSINNKRKAVNCMYSFSDNASAQKSKRTSNIDGEVNIKDKKSVRKY